MKSIIVGGGIAGLATAIGLHKNGYEAEVYEAAPEFKPAGAGILLAPNGMETLRRLDQSLFEDVKQRGNLITTLKVSTQNGKTLAGSGFKNGHLCYAIHRAELIDSLAALLPHDALHTGKRFDSFANTDNAVKVSFEDGTEASGDFLVGTDGIYSRVRNQLLGEQPYRYAQQTCWRSIVPFQLPKAYNNTFTEVWGKERGLRVGFGAINEEQIYFFATYFTPAGGKDETGLLKDRLLDIYKDFPPVVLDFIKTANPANILRNDIYDLAPVDQWFKSKVVLVGDAAHATTPNMGQGGNQALESAWAFGECMGAAKGNIANGFAQYQQQRLKKAHKIVNDSWRISEMVNLKSSVARGLRNCAMQLIPPQLAAASLKKVYALDYEF